MSDDELKSAIAFNSKRDLPDEISKREFARLVYAAQEHADLTADGKYGTKSFAVFGAADAAAEPDYAKIFAGGFHPLPIYGGVKPRLTSGFIALSGRGPNKSRLKYTGNPHYGGDLGYWWDGNGGSPLGYWDYHFDGRNEQLFYFPPVEVRAILDGEVESVGRCTVRIYHGELEGFGHFSTWSTHHKALHVRKGQTVDAGKVIATAGDTNTKGAPHVHQEAWRWQTGEQFTRELHALDLAPILPHLRIRAPG